MSEVAINARAAVRAQIGGVERLALEMTRRLPALRPDRYRVIAPPAALAHAAGHVWEQAVLPIRAAGASLLYSPANLAPVLGAGNVVVIHDAAALRHPAAYSRPYVAYHRRLLPLLARRARLVLTVSEFARRELIDLLDAEPAKVEVVPPGVGGQFAPDADPGPVAARHNLGRPYVLAVGTASARKNHGALNAAARALAAHGLELVIAGSDRGYLRDAQTGPAERSRSSSRDAATPRRLGYVSEQELPGLYAGARALAMPSLHEGFGLPCLEAMACGTPVVIAPRGALPETCADAALSADPQDAEVFADAVLRAACERELHAQLVSSGLRRAALFPWSATAAATDEAITRLLDRS